MTRPLRRSRRATKGQRPVAWSRTKLLALLAGGVVVAVLLLAGLTLAVVEAVGPAGTGPGHGPVPRTPNRTDFDGRVSGGSVLVGAGLAADLAAREELAARPMPAVPESASHPMPVSVTDPGAPILLPPSTRIGPAGVPSGYPHTPQGALAQLAAINQTALNTASMVGVRTVITGWALPGGPTTSTWSGVHAMAALLTAAGMSGGGSGQLAVVATPLMGLVKGTVGHDFVIPCLDMELDVTATVTARGAVADCQQMVWQAGRWWIGPGPEPAVGPSVWPDTDLAVQVGYRDLRRV